MSVAFRVDVGILLGGLLLAVGVVASGIAARYRVPSLLLFLALGMLVADDGLAIIRFDDVRLAQDIAIVALLVILFEGGLTTDPGALRRSAAPSFVLSTLGVVTTAGVVGAVAWWLLDLPPSTAFLLGSVVASTDAAAVFTAVRGEPLPGRVRDLLTLESGMNDPVAVMLTIGMVEVWRSDPSAVDWVSFVTIQLVGGVVVGLAAGALARAAIQRFEWLLLPSVGVLTLGVAGISYAIATQLGGSGFLAVYVAGVVLAATRRPMSGVMPFHEGLAATAQAVLFLLLGLLVFPSRLVDDLAAAGLVTAVLVIVARPAMVHAILTPFGVPQRQSVLVSWAGLRGAVPVVLATIPLTAGHPDGALVFDVAFVVVVISVALQAPLVTPLARWLGVSTGDVISEG